MPGKRPEKPRIRDAAMREAAAREQRLAEALRANLRRRKSQARSRMEKAKEPGEPG